MTSGLLRRIGAYPEMLAVIAAAIIGLTVRSPFAWLASHQGINVLLAILVFATAITIEPSRLRALVTTWRRLALAIAAGATVLPGVAWIVSRVVAAGSLRDGVLSVGFAPCEIASVATTAMAGGEAAFSAGVLIGSTVAAVALAGPILSLEAGHAAVHPWHIIGNLALVVALPLAGGLGLRMIRPAVARAQTAATLTATVAVAALVALIAAEVHLSTHYVDVVVALAAFLAVSAALGALLGRGATRPVAVAELLTTSMRDFAIAAGLAASAFGTRAAAPLGLYGIMVLVWGTCYAGRSRTRGVGRPVGEGGPTASQGGEQFNGSP